MNDSSRLKMIDYVKAIAVILVVFGHCNSTNIVNRMIYSFHMPLFFLISGYLIAYKDPTRSAFLPFLKKKFMKIMIPYFFFEFVNLIVSFILLKSGICEDYVVDFPYAILNIFICFVDPLHYDALLVRFWFFPSIFFAYIFVYWGIRLYNVFKKKIDNKRYVSTIYFLFMAALFYAFSFIERKIANGVLLWFCLDSALMGTAFIFLGIALKPLWDKYFNLNAIIHFIVFVLCIAVDFASVKFNYSYYVFMSLNQYGSYLWFGIGAIAGSLATVSFVSLTEKILPEKPMRFFAANSGNMFGVQCIAMFLSGHAFYFVFSLLPSFGFQKQVYFILFFVFSLILCVPLCMLVNKIPFVGNNKTIKSVK